MKKPRHYRDPFKVIRADAHFSVLNNEEFRYELIKTWNSNSKIVAFIGLNPSIASHKNNDLTVVKCMTWAESWGYGSMVMLNLFAYIATDPKDLESKNYPVGVDNDSTLKKWTKEVDLVVACWGNQGGANERDFEVVNFLKTKKLMALGFNKSGRPKHPRAINERTILERNLLPISNSSIYL